MEGSPYISYRSLEDLMEASRPLQLSYVFACSVETRVQGLIWLALAVIAEVPTVVFLWLNLNGKRDNCPVVLSCTDQMV